MNQFDRRFLTAILAPIFPILLFLTGWWVGLVWVPDNRVFLIALAGLCLGLGLNIILLKQWVSRAYYHSPLWVIIYAFYSIGCFGFFMGVPIFNVFLGIPLGMYVARQTKVLKYSSQKARQRIETVSRISAIFMASACFFSAAIALTDPYTANNLKGMFNLPFVPTIEMIRWLIGIGGIGLVIASYFLTCLAAHLTDLAN